MEPASEAGEGSPVSLSTPYLIRHIAAKRALDAALANVRAAWGDQHASWLAYTECLDLVKAATAVYERAWQDYLAATQPDEPA